MSDAVLFGEPMQLNCATQCARDGIQAGKLWATRKPDIKKQEPQKSRPAICRVLVTTPSSR